MEINFPSSRDIYIEVDGRKLAAVESYKVQATRSIRHIGAFGEKGPVATFSEEPKYEIVLTRVCACKDELGNFINFYGAKNFDLVISKPGAKVVYSGCLWSGITENGELGKAVIEKISVLSTTRGVFSL